MRSAAPTCSSRRPWRRAGARQLLGFEEERSNGELYPLALELALRMEAAGSLDPTDGLNADSSLLLALKPDYGIDDPAAGLHPR